MWTPEKWAGFSRAIIGGIMLAVTLAISIGVQLGEDDVNKIRLALEGIAGSIGILLVFVGRFGAKSNLYVNPFK